MKFTKTIILAILLYSFNLTAQNQEHPKTLKKEYLKSLTIASKEDITNRDLTLDGEKIPFYDVNGKRVKGMKLLLAFQSGKYIPDFYINNDKEIKVIVLRLLKKEEKDDKNIAVGSDAPDFTATDINGNEYSLNDLKGKIIVLNFWFTECQPCITEMPELNELVKKHEGKNVVFLGFAIDDASEIDSFLKKKEFSYKIIPNSENIANSYGVRFYPTHIVIDQSSKITSLVNGLLPTTINELEKAIGSLIKE